MMIAQSIVPLEDKILMSGVKAAIRMLRGITPVKVCKDEAKPNAKTLQAMREVESGDTTVCGTKDRTP